MMPIGFDFQCFGRKSEIHLCLHFLTSKVETPPQKDHLERLLADLLNERISQICLSFVKLVLLGIIWGWAGLASYWWKQTSPWVSRRYSKRALYFFLWILKTHFQSSWQPSWSSWECVCGEVWILALGSGWHNPLIFSGAPPATTGLMPVTSSSAFVLHWLFFFSSSSLYF